jgi:hypothetical protein
VVLIARRMFDDSIKPHRLSQENVAALQPHQAPTDFSVHSAARQTHEIDVNEVTMADPVDSGDEVSFIVLYFGYTLAWNDQWLIYASVALRESP